MIIVAVERFFLSPDRRRASSSSRDYICKGRVCVDAKK